jgi:hypothetical protein
MSTLQHTTLTTNIHSPAGFEIKFSAGEPPQTHALNRAVTVTGKM